jgi:hypothetical protein
LEDTEVIIVKGAGYDWVVTFRWEEDEPETMSVFGVLTVEDAVREARYSLDAPAGEVDWPGYEILSVARM